MRIQARLVAALRDYLASDASARVPDGGELLWQWFCDLSTARSFHAAGPNPIAYADIAAYCHLMRVPLEPRHVAVLKAMDRAYLQYASERANAKLPEGVKALRPSSGQAMTPALFDAMMG